VDKELLRAVGLHKYSHHILSEWVALETELRQLKQLAELERQHADLVIVQVEFPQACHVPDLGWQSTYFVVGGVQALQISQAGYGGR